MTWILGHLAVSKKKGKKKYAWNPRTKRNQEISREAGDDIREDYQFACLDEALAVREELHPNVYIIGDFNLPVPVVMSILAKLQQVRESPYTPACTATCDKDFIITFKEDQ